MTATFTVSRKDLRRGRWLEAPTPALGPGQIRLRIDRFALTSNNVTYGAFGDAMSYWDFFPTGDPTTGCIPVWGFATVMETNTFGVGVGQRFYGYFPMADEAVLGPIRVDALGFVDGSEHRHALHGIYNRYLLTDTDALYRPEHEDFIALLRPLFSTSFLIDDFLAENAFFDAGTVLVSSASSKTSYGLGFCLSQRRGTGAAVATVGLTSSANLEFTRRLGCYDRVVAYPDTPSLVVEPAAYVDMSGSSALRSMSSPVSGTVMLVRKPPMRFVDTFSHSPAGSPRVPLTKTRSEPS